MRSLAILTVLACVSCKDRSQPLPAPSPSPAPVVAEADAGLASLTADSFRLFLPKNWETRGQGTTHPGASSPDGDDLSIAMMDPRRMAFRDYADFRRNAAQELGAEVEPMKEEMLGDMVVLTFRAKTLAKLRHDGGVAPNMFGAVVRKKTPADSPITSFSIFSAKDVDQTEVLGRAVLAGVRLR